MKQSRIVCALLILFQFISVKTNAQYQSELSSKPFLTLKGSVDRKSFQTYLEVPFAIPDNVKRMTVYFTYNRNQRTTIDLGILDPEKFRGWSGGTRDSFTISDQDATPGYLAGALPAGQWKLLLGIPNIKENVKANYEAKIYIDTDYKITEFYDRPINTKPGWYRGDFHMHSGNSDGKCKAQSGLDAPCPVFKVVEAAANKSLDFIALTDHNTNSHAEALRELQPYFNQILLVPGREITTFYGHSNVFGLTDFLDFRTLKPSYSESKKWMDIVNQAGGIVSINHAGVPSGENCMGCGWQINDIPKNVISTVEILNGGSMNMSLEGKIQGWDLWHKLLNEGQHITAIGGSDDHRSSENSATIDNIGRPTTVIFMKELSVNALLAGLKSGKAFVDVEGTPDRFIDVFAANTSEKIEMGSTLKAKIADLITISIIVKGAQNGKVELVVNGKVENQFTKNIPTNEANVEINYKIDKNNTHIYAKVYDDKNNLILVSNPVYFEK
ncbi:MAG: CehA/McbA family metallohydrolase [Weeksellaceae bacterium]|nr:CehA/McbA family metallohydrolase [Weeksellaceae bacterium]